MVSQANSPTSTRATAIPAPIWLSSSGQSRTAEKTSPRRNGRADMEHLPLSRVGESRSSTALVKAGCMRLFYFRLRFLQKKWRVRGDNSGAGQREIPTTCGHSRPASHLHLLLQVG